MIRRLRPGDVLEVEFPRVPSPEAAFPNGGFGYVAYVGKHPEDGDAIQIRPLVFAVRPQITDELFSESFVALYPAHLALKEGLATVVGRVTPMPMPTIFRRRGGIDRSGKVLNWLIEQENVTISRDSLTPAERQLPIASVWNHELLLIRISQGWKPESLY